MTTHELARLLLEGPDIMATVDGYEEGVDEVTGLDPQRPLRLNVNTAWYYGKHAYFLSEFDDEDPPRTTAINIR